MLNNQNYALSWTQIRALAESKSFWSLNILLIVVPFISRVLPWSISVQIFLLYLASILVTIATLLYFICRPEIVTLRSSNEFKNLGKLPEHLGEEYEACGYKINNITDTTIKTALQANTFSGVTVDKVFWYVHKYLNMSKKHYRQVITFLYLIAFFILFWVNMCHFMTVMDKVW